MEYIELDFLGNAQEIDPNFTKLYEEITGHKIKKKDQDKKIKYKRLKNKKRQY